MKRKTRKKNNGLTSLIIIFISVFFLTMLILVQFEEKVVPSLQQISYNYSMAIANELIDECVQGMMDELSLTYMDLITLTDKEYGTYTTNTQQINLFCTTLNKNINTAMQNLPNEEISIPLGAVTNSNYFANFGPKIPFTLMPAGSVSSDYETSFVAAGINQVNYKIWINLSLDIQIVNPLYREKITLNKKIMLVDTIIGGRVPEYFFNGS